MWSTVHHGAVAAGHECSSVSRLQPPVTGPRYTGTDRAALVADNSSSPVQTVSARALSCCQHRTRLPQEHAISCASQRALRSATNNMVVPRSRLKFRERAFSIAAPRAWNSIPADLRATLNTATFKKNLKTILFRESYSSF